MDRISEIAEEALKALLPGAKHAEYRICLAWETVVGPEVAAKSWPVRVSGKTLTVAVENSVWANQLGFMSEELCRRLSEALGGELVEHIRFTVKPPPE